MAIRNVNGRNVYILEPREPTGKTTTGKNWATLYTDLRWQVWEQIQKNEAAMLKMEMASAKVRKDYYDDKIKVLQDQRKQLQSAALKGETGNAGSANRDFFAGARILQRDAEATSKLTKTKITPEQTIAGVTIPESREITEVAREGGGLPAATREGLQLRMDLMTQELKARSAEGKEAAESKEAAEGKAAAPVGPTIDQQIEALDRDLEQLLLQRQVAGGGLDADLLGRTRESFASQVGVIGQGGGPFGLAPRRRRTMPYVQESLAQERIDEFVPAYQAQQSRVEEEQKKLADLQKARQDVILLITPEEAADKETMSRNEALLAGLNQEIETQKSAVQTAMQPLVDLQAEVTPREPGELLLRDRPRIPAGEFEPPRMAGQEEVSSPAAMRRAEERLEAIDRGLEPLQEPVPPISEMGPAAPAPAPAPVERLPEPVAAPVTLPTDEEIVFGPGEVTVEPQVQVKEGQAELGGGYVFDGQSGIIFGPTGFPVFATFEQQVPADVEPPKVVSEVALRGIAQRIRQSGGDISSVSGYQSKEARPEDFELEEEEFPMEPAGPPQGSSRQRKDKYKFDVVSEGTKLARTPKKLQRLAKTNLPEENRPEHYVIVDKLYDVNRGKEQAFKMTYDEISRAFQNDPQKRSDAHKYLVAKDILEADVSEPLA